MQEDTELSILDDIQRISPNNNNVQQIILQHGWQNTIISKTLNHITLNHSLYIVSYTPEYEYMGDI